MKFYTADKETGTFIDEFDSYEEAVEAIKKYELEDQSTGIYEPNFYDVVEKEHCSILV